MKLGMTVLKKQQVKDRWVWLCEELLPGQGCREWATYISVLPDETRTEYGHYFVNKSNAVQDYQTRLNSI